MIRSLATLIIITVFAGCLQKPEIPGGIRHDPFYDHIYRTIFCMQKCFSSQAGDMQGVEPALFLNNCKTTHT